MPENLTLEQELKLRTFVDKVERLNHKESKKLLVQIYAEMLVQEIGFKRTLQQKWGMGDASS